MKICASFAKLITVAFILSTSSCRSSAPRPTIEERDSKGGVIEIRGSSLINGRVTLLPRSNLIEVVAAIEQENGFWQGIGTLLIDSGEEPTRVRHIIDLRRTSIREALGMTFEGGTVIVVPAKL